MRFIEEGKVSHRKMKIEMSNLQAIHLVSLLKQIPLEENLTKLIIITICDQLYKHFNAMQGYDLMVMQEEIKKL